MKKLWEKFKLFIFKCKKWKCGVWHGEEWSNVIELRPNDFSLSSYCPKCKRGWKRDMMTGQEMIQIAKWARQRDLSGRDLRLLLPTRKDRNKLSNIKPL